MPLKFSSVQHRESKVSIVGTGESLKGFDLELPRAVIAVNGAIDILSHVDYWFTLDPSPGNQGRMKNRREGVFYYAAVPDDFNGIEGVCYLHRITGEGHGRYKTKSGLCPTKDSIHTGNSAWGALQLAVHMGARKIALFGVDGYGSYVYGGKPRQLVMMPELFASADLRGIEVVNGSPESTVTCFPRMTPDEARAWLM